MIAPVFDPKQDASHIPVVDNPTMRPLLLVASLKTTLWLLLAFATMVLSYYLTSSFNSGWLAIPLGLLAMNLLAAIATNPVFMRQTPLLLFHLALLAVLVLITLGRLTYLSGWLELTEGESFAGTLTGSVAGPFHHNGLDKVNFTQGHFTIDYNPGRQRGTTRSTLYWLDASGNKRQGLIGDHRPFVQQGYRFYTTHNKGFAPLFDWQPAGGTPQQGSIHLPAWPAHEFKQSLDWTIPGTSHNLWTQLHFDEVILDPKKPSQFRTPQEHYLVVRYENQRHELRPGQSIDFADGRLTYRELRTWMGFTVFYDWTLPWLFAAGLVAVLSLGWHYWRKFAARPWLQEEN